MMPTGVLAKTSESFAKMSFVSACLVVGQHSLSCDHGGSAVKIIYMLLCIVCKTAVPWFFFASGFFIAGRIGEDGWWLRELKKRVRSILIPFWTWGIISLLFYSTIALAMRLCRFKYGGDDALLLWPLSGLLRVAGVSLFETMPTLWFLRTLFVLILLSPIIACCRVIFPVISLAVLIFYDLAVSPENKFLVGLMGSRGLVSLSGLFYFSAGIYIRSCIYNKYNDRTDRIAMLVCGFIAIAFIPLCLCHTRLCVWITPALLYLIYRLIRYVSIPGFLLKLSFPIYVIHMMIVFLITGVYSVIGIGGVGKISFLEGLCRWGFSLLLSIMVSLNIRRYFPRFSHLAFGCR